MDEGDYPAAHSMDTAFFAVDRAGHIGYFQSGPSGAVPVTGEAEIGDPRGPAGQLDQLRLHCEALRGQAAGSARRWGAALDQLGLHCEALLEQLAQLLPHCEARHDLAGHRPPDLFGRPQRHDLLRPDWEGTLEAIGQLLPGIAAVRHDPPDRLMVARVLLFLKSLDPALRAEIAAGRGVELPAVGAVAVQAPGLPPDLVQRLHDEGQCLGCFIRTLTLAEVQASPANFGLFCYTPALDNWMAAPYGRREVPVRPVHIDQLPPDFRQQFGRLQLDFSFAERAYVQPVEHWPCTSWEPAFLSSDGRKIGRVPDVAGEHWSQSYAEFYADLTGAGESWLRAIEIEPPAGTD